MTDSNPATLRRENDYLKQRCARLQDDVTDLVAQVVRLTQQLEHITEKRLAHLARSNQLQGGQ